MKTKRNLILQQIKLADEIKAKANINIVTCGHCGTILLHQIKSINEENNIVCFGCKHKMNLSDCPDLFYSGMENNLEFNQ